MPRRDWRLRVADVLSAIERIRRYTTGLDRASFQRDERTVEAVCFALVVIGEAASHVPEDVQAAAPAIPWRKMKASRPTSTSASISPPCGRLRPWTSHR